MYLPCHSLEWMVCICFFCVFPLVLFGLGREFYSSLYVKKTLQLLSTSRRLLFSRKCIMSLENRCLWMLKVKSNFSEYSMIWSRTFAMLRSSLKVGIFQQMSKVLSLFEWIKYYWIMLTITEVRLIFMYFAKLRGFPKFKYFLGFVSFKFFLGVKA